MFKGIAGGGHYNRDGNGANTLSLRTQLRHFFQLFKMTTGYRQALYMDQNINSRRGILQ